MNIKKNEKINLTLILRCFSMGGAERMIYELIKYINLKKFNVTVICYGKRINTPLELAVDKCLKVEYLNVTGRIGIKSMIKVLRCINKTKPDVIHAHLGGITFALPWAVIHKKPMIVTLHTTAEKAFSAKNEKIIRRYITKQNIKLVAVSEDNQKSIQKYFDIEQTKCLCVNNGIDIEHYYHNKTNYFTFLNVGRHDDNKNQKMIITCFAKLIKKKCNIRLILVGEGPNTELLKNQVREAGIENKVIFTGMIADPTYYYINSDCYIQSSHREAMPLSVLEAMASSLPIISTNVGGLKDVVDECNGFLIPDGDETALYIAMRSLYEMNSSIRDELGKSSRKRVVRYSSKKMAEEYENIYKKCV